jgi:FG-GAP-like repeat
MLAVAVMAVVPVATGIAPYAAAGSACVDGWQPMPLETALAGMSPKAAAALGGAPAWIAGSRLSSASIGRWDGSTWRKVSQPFTGETGFAGISTKPDSAAWAVGYRSLLAPHPITARWTGSSWEQVEVPYPGGHFATFTDVIALGPKKALAVGVRLVRGLDVPLAMLRTKAGWSDLSPDFAGVDGSLTAIAQAPDTKLWAVGWQAPDGRPVPWIGKLENGVWVSSPPATTPAGLAYLTDIAFDSAGVGWSAGYAELDDGGYAPLLQRWDGTDWRAEGLPWADGESIVLTSIAVDAGGDLFLGGQRVGDAGASAVFATYTGGEWHVTAGHSDAYPGTWTYDAAELTDGALMVGLFPSAGRVLTSCDITGPPTARPPHGPEDGAAGFATDAEHIVPGVTTGSGAALTLLPPVPLDGYHATDVSQAAGLKMTTKTYGSVVADFNGDSWQDIFLNRHASDVPLLMLGGPTGFTNSGAQFQFTDRFNCDADEATGEGGLDLFCTVGRQRGTAMGANELYIDVGTNGGTLAPAQFGVLGITERGREAAFVHLAGQPLPDLFVANWPVRIDGLPSMNRYYRNVDGTRFTPAPEYGLDQAAGGQCLVPVNIDGDGDDEILLCTLQPVAGLTAGLRLYDFDGSAFVDETAGSGLTPFGDQDIEVADFNGDSLPDVAQLKAKRLRISLGDGTGQFTRAVEYVVKAAVEMAVGDVNEDSRPDIYVSSHASNNDKHRMLVNDGDGTSFTSVIIPEASSGSADDVLALDYDNNGLTDFLVLNGLERAGPVKLTAFFPDEP